MGLRSGLRADAVERAGGVCEWRHCAERLEEMAHLRGRGMGGRASADQLDNVAMLCRFHHDLLDGRRRPTIERLYDCIRPLRPGGPCRWFGCSTAPSTPETGFCDRHLEILDLLENRQPVHGLRVVLAETVGYWIASPFTE